MAVLNKAVFHAEYFPAVDWYALWLQEEISVIDTSEYFVRKSNRNRCMVNGPNGAIMLSVPLEGGRNQKIRMKDVKIANHEKWATVHWRTLDACYRRTPFFEYFEMELQAIFSRKYNFLVDLNLATLDFYNKALKVKKEVILDSNFTLGATSEIVDYRFQHPLCKPLEPYMQPFVERNGFIADLSMLDMLFCIGKESLDRIKNSFQ